MQADDIFTPPGQHTLILGMNGSGKSIMLMEQARQATKAPVIIYDTKADDDFMKLAREDETIVRVHTLSEFNALLKQPRGKLPTYIVVTPVIDELLDVDLLDQYLVEQYHKLPNSYAMIDEVYAFHNQGKSGKGLIEILTRGRSRKVSLVMCSQRPKWISLFCKTEVRRIIAYNLQGADDKKELSQIAYFPKDLVLPPFYFWGYKVGDNDGTLFKPLQLRFEPGAQIEKNRWIGREKTA